MTLALAGGTGLYLGYRAHRSSEQLTDERNAARGQQFDITRETNRVLMELWRMEDAEKRTIPP